jgi:glycosyltransferase 2 family protein
VAAAVARLGADAVAAALPMLQPVALTGDTRAALRRSRGLLHNIREAVAALHPVVEPEPVKLDRLRPRTLFTLVSLAFAGYLLLAQASAWRVPTHVAWAWVGVAALASAATYAAAAMAIDGMVPERLRRRTTLEVQVAAAYASLVAPAAVGGVAVNNRYLQRSGIPPVAAAAAVGAQQLNGLVQHLLMLMVFGVIAGNEGRHHSGDDPISSLVVAVMLAAALLILLIATIPPLRRFALARLRPLAAGVLPRLIEVAQRPAKLLTALGGAALLSLTYITALWASVKAVSPPGTEHISFAMAGVVFLSGQAVGSAFPTPGGIGTVEASLSVGLGWVIGGADIVASAVMVFRLLTFWLPVLPGWLAYRRLQQRGTL